MPCAKKGSFYLILLPCYLGYSKNCRWHGLIQQEKNNFDWMGWKRLKFTLPRAKCYLKNELVKWIEVNVWLKDFWKFRKLFQIRKFRFFNLFDASVFHHQMAADEVLNVQKTVSLEKLDLVYHATPKLVENYIMLFILHLLYPGRHNQSFSSSL